MMFLTGRNIVVLDLETRSNASDCFHCGKTEEEHVTRPVGTCNLPFEAIGWDRKPVLGLSIGCYWDYCDRRLVWFDRHTLAATMRVLTVQAPLLVSFNGIGFDFPLMRGLLRQEAEASQSPVYAASLVDLCDRFKALCAGSYDLLRAIWTADPARRREPGLNSLGAISEANGYGAKAMDGAMAPRLWAQGRYAELIHYNVDDVLKTRRLFEQIVATGSILRGDGQSISLAPPALPE